VFVQIYISLYTDDTGRKTAAVKLPQQKLDQACDDDDDGNNCKQQKKWQPRLHESTDTTWTHRQT